MVKTEGSGKKIDLAAVDATIKPAVDDMYSLGSELKRWKKVWAVALAAVLITATTLSSNAINVTWLNATYLNASLDANGNSITNAGTLEAADGQFGVVNAGSYPNITLNDSAKVLLGNSQDAEIYWDGFKLVIKVN